MISCLRKIRSFEKCCEGFENFELVFGSVGFQEGWRRVWLWQLWLEPEW